MSGRVKGESRLSESFVIGAITMVFLIVGYQTALFVHNAAVTKIVAGRDEPDTVYVCQGDLVRETDAPRDPVRTERHNASHDKRVEAVRNNMPGRKIESFPFDPNTVSVDDLCRLGFSLKQAQSIDNYRKKGGHFHRKEDFARSYVVSDSIFRRLSSFIDIPLVDINVADSAALDALPGIGGWFASRIIAHRKALGGYSCKEQLMDIYRFDKEKFDGLSDLITVSEKYVTPYPLWSLPADSLRLHPYIGNLEMARAIVLFRENNPPHSWEIGKLVSAGVIGEETARKLAGCIIEKPQSR